MPKILERVGEKNQNHSFMFMKRKKILLLYAGWILSLTTMCGQELPKLKVIEKEMNTASVFRRADDNETVVEIQSNVLLSFESTMDKAVNV
ncbi:MAG: hypothetical protein LBB41_04185, partial [Prevotellaceae bacterium]|nr:hypothetical protein [Prevotellaceae bacterium]